MRGVILLTCAMTLVWVPASLGQKAKPNFSGSWLLVSPQNGGPDGAETITQDATTLTMAHPSEGGSHTMRYRLDGSETLNSMAGMAFNSKASWDGEKLVLTYRRAQTGSGSSAAPETKQVLSLESSGRLVIEYTTPGDGGKVDSGKLIFRKGSQKS